jgi:hypothetical protein
LAPRSPDLKGKVERIVDPIRRLFQTYDFATYNLESAQEHINKKMHLHNESKHSTHQLRPLDVLLNDEVSLLKALPSLPYELETLVFSTIRNDGYVRFDYKYYRVDPKLSKEQALIIGNNSTVSIYCRGKLLECYARIRDRFVNKACKDHYKEPWEKTLQDQQYYLKMAAKIGGDVERFINIVLARGAGFVDTRVVWGILSLNKKYQNEDINKACCSAIELSQVRYQAVVKLLSITATQKQREQQVGTSEDYQTKNGKFSRPMSEYKNHLHLV